MSQSQVCNGAGGFTYCASSVLEPQQGNTYNPRNLVDGRLETAWVEGVGGDGTEEWILVDFNGLRRVTGVKIWNGYNKNIDIFSKNNRVRTLSILLSNGYRTTINLSDRGGEQEFNFSNGGVATWMQLEITAVYRGNKYRDTAISELRVMTSTP